MRCSLSTNEPVKVLWSKRGWLTFRCLSFYFMAKGLPSSYHKVQEIPSGEISPHMLISKCYRFWHSQPFIQYIDGDANTTLCSTYWGFFVCAYLKIKRIHDIKLVLAPNIRTARSQPILHSLQAQACHICTLHYRCMDLLCFVLEKLSCINKVLCLK